MNKKAEIKMLKHDLNVCKSKLYLLQQHENLQLYLINENIKLTKKLEDNERGLAHVKGVLFNYQTPYLAG